MDAALYDLSPPKVTTLYSVTVPKGKHQIVRYDDGTSNELEVPLGTTAFVSGLTMFEILPPELKSLVVRSKVRYAPHPYDWMAPSRALSTGLGIVSDGLEMPLNELPEWEESKIKTLPVVRSKAVPFTTSRHPNPDRRLPLLVLAKSCHGSTAFAGSSMRRSGAFRGSPSRRCFKGWGPPSGWCTHHQFERGSRHSLQDATSWDRPKGAIHDMCWADRLLIAQCLM